MVEQATTVRVLAPTHRKLAELAAKTDTSITQIVADAVERVEVVVTAAIERERRTLDEAALGWGHEKVTSVTTEKVGTAIQRFVVEVAA